MNQIEQCCQSELCTNNFMSIPAQLWILFTNCFITLKLINSEMCIKISGALTIFVDNTPGTAGGPGGRDQMLAVKTLEIQHFFS